MIILRIENPPCFGYSFCERYLKDIDIVKLGGHRSTIDNNFLYQSIKKTDSLV